MLLEIRFWVSRIMSRDDNARGCFIVSVALAAIALLCFLVLPGAAKIAATIPATFSVILAVTVQSEMKERFRADRLREDISLARDAEKYAGMSLDEELEARAREVARAAA